MRHRARHDKVVKIERSEIPVSRKFPLVPAVGASTQKVSHCKVGGGEENVRNECLQIVEF